MVKNTQRRIRLEMEALEGRLVPACCSVQLAGGALVVQGADTPDSVQVCERGSKIEVVVTDLSSGAAVQQSFRKDKVHDVQLRQGSAGNDVFDDELHDRHITCQTFSQDGQQIDGNFGGGTTTCGHG
jgi:hypothetical protein